MAGELQRKLTTILAADAEGYSRAMGVDEAGTIAGLRAARDVFSRFIARHHGRIANTAGDGLIAEFPSVVEAVQCAVEVQNELTSLPQGAALRFRIGIHLGDVIVDGNDLLGDGVNLAARLQSMAEPGGVLISRQVYEQVRAKLTVGFEYLGEKRPKNLAEDVSVYRIAMGGQGSAKTWRSALSGPPRAEPASVPQTPDDRQRRLVRLVQAGAVLGGVLVAIDIFTKGALWVHYPLTALAVGFGWLVAPLVAQNAAERRTIRTAVLIVGLVLINVFTWSGDAWAMWPVGALIALEILRRVKGAGG